MNIAPNVDGYVTNRHGVTYFSRCFVRVGPLNVWVVVSSLGQFETQQLFDKLGWAHSLPFVPDVFEHICVYTLGDVTEEDVIKSLKKLLGGG